jgi:hypothetical protein
MKCAGGVTTARGQVIPLVDFESQDAAAGTILKLRTLILREHKTPVVAKVLKAVRAPDISRPSISIDRTKARWGDGGGGPGGTEHSIFAQIYRALGERQGSSLPSDGV